MDLRQRPAYHQLLHRSVAHAHSLDAECSGNKRSSLQIYMGGDVLFGEMVEGWKNHDAASSWLLLPLFFFRSLSGHERFRTLTSSYYRGDKGIITGADWWAQPFGKSLPFLSWVPLINEIPTNKVTLFAIIVFAIIPTSLFNVYNVCKVVQARKGSMLLALAMMCVTSLLL
ncbi:unnamed protein product [Camellia sinensis]